MLRGWPGYLDGWYRTRPYSLARSLGRRSGTKALLTAGVRLLVGDYGTKRHGMRFYDPCKRPGSNGTPSLLHQTSLRNRTVAPTSLQEEPIGIYAVLSQG